MSLFLIFAGFLSNIGQLCGSHLAEQKFRNTINDCIAKPSWTLIPNLNDCQKFYLCINGMSEELTCGTNFYFDPMEKRCKIGACQSAEFTTRCKSQIIRRSEDNCNAFSLCENGRYVKQNCTAGFYFSTNQASCQPISASADHKCSCLLPRYATISNPDDCETYYICTEEGKAALQQCQRGQYFNERVSSCLPNFNGICMKAPTISSAESVMVEMCKNVGINAAVFKPSDKCDKFFSCKNGRMATRRCPKGFYFDLSTHYCQWDASGKCTKQSTHILDDHDWENADEKQPKIHKKNEDVSIREVNKQIKNINAIKQSNKINADGTKEVGTIRKVILKILKEPKEIAYATTTEIVSLDTDVKYILEDNNEKEKGKLMDSHVWSSTGKLTESSDPQATYLYAHKSSIYNKLSSKFLKF